MDESMDAETIERMRAMLARARKDLTYQLTVQQAITALGRGLSFVSPPSYNYIEGGVGETRWIDIYRADVYKCRWTFTPKPGGTRCSLNWFDGPEVERITSIGLLDFHLKEMEAEAGQRAAEMGEYQSPLSIYSLVGDIVTKSIQKTIARWEATQSAAPPPPPQPSTGETTPTTQAPSGDGAALNERQDGDKSDSAEAKVSQGDGEPKLWEHIPDRGQNRLVLELWCKGLTYDLIAGQAGLSFSRVKNLISELRKKHGSEIVPHHRKKSG